ncbi:MAG: sugar transporter [Alteromonadaceae bacterium]|nr:MAG: sugar transporter [Alteromonadaceae bacterium]
MKSISKIPQILAALFVGVLIAACGNPGPLVLPGDAAPKQATPTPTTEQALKTGTAQDQNK